MKKLTLTLALCFAAGGGHATDLLSVYRDAVAYDATFASAKAAVEAGREKLPQGRAGLLPTIGLEANTTWNNIDTIARGTGLTTNASSNTNGWNVRLSQPLFSWQNWASYGKSELAVVAYEAQFNAAKMDLVVRTAKAYFDALLAQDALATARAQKAAIAQQLESAKRNFEVGTQTIVDTHEAQAKFDLIEATEIAAENDVLVKQHALQLLTGKAPDALKGLRKGVTVSLPMPADINQWVSIAETGSASVQAAQAGFEMAQRDIEIQRAGHYPTLSLEATVGRANNATRAAPPTTDQESSTIGLKLSLPLFAGGYFSSKDREAVALKEKAAAELDAARRSAAFTARQAYLGVTFGLSQVKAYEAAVVSSQSALDSNKLGYEVGVRINIDVLNAQTQLYEMTQKLAKARLDTLGASLQLKAAAGTLSEEDVQAVNSLLD